MQIVKSNFSKIYSLTACVVLLVASGSIFAGKGDEEKEKDEGGEEVQTTVTLRQCLRRIKDEYGINCLNQPLRDRGEVTMSALLGLLNLPPSNDCKEVSWSKEEREFCQKRYNKEPVEPKRFREIPVIEVEASKLSNYVPYGNVIWGLRIRNADDTTLGLLEKFPKLMSLNLYYHAERDESDIKPLPLQTVGEAGVQSLSTHCRSLKELKLGGCSWLTDAHIDSIVRGCSQLTRLDLTLCHRLTDKSLESIARYCPRLTRLNLFIWSRVNDSGLLHLKHLPTLRLLGMRDGELLERKGIRRLLRSLGKPD